MQQPNQPPSAPIINGLVLAGGRSVRMGADKGLMEWHGREQRYYMADLLKGLCNEVFISCRPDQRREIDINYKVLTDSFTGLGPYGAILSAFREHPDTAWLVVACDLPLLDTATLKYLIAHRHPDATATTFISPHDGLPEPLITIWEPRSYPILLSLLNEGSSCPRKALRSSDVHLLKAPDPQALMNANTPEEAEQVLEIIGKQAARV